MNWVEAVLAALQIIQQLLPVLTSAISLEQKLALHTAVLNSDASMHPTTKALIESVKPTS